MEVKDWIDRARTEFNEFDLAAVRRTGILPGEGEKFFPVIGYPPLTMYREMDEGPLFHELASRPPRPVSGYLHIPFCPTRCTYCHWITKTRSKSEEVDRYLDYLVREMKLYRSKMGMERIPLKSVLWGGGTPTYPDAAQLGRLLEAYHETFDLSECTQFSVEAEPTTLLGKEGKARLRVLKEYGVDRISLGVQSLNDVILRYMGRAHSHAQTVESIENMRAAGIENVFIDLIYGYPGQTLEDWVENMLGAIAMDVEGYQLYRLRIRQHGDRAGSIVKQFSKYPEKFHRSDDILMMKYLGKMISEELGYHEYQRRVFAKRADLISHYLRDWCCHLHDVVGVGVSSWSNLRGVFSQNIGDQDLEMYYSYIDNDAVSINRGKTRTQDDEIRRNFILPLKNSFVDKDEFNRLTGMNPDDYFGDKIAFMKSIGMIEEDERRLWLTAKGGFFADEVTTQFFNPDYLPFPEVLQTSSA